MKLCIHRGTHQIGGIAAEISTASTRILIDMGDELSLDPNFVSAPLNIPGVTDGNGHCDAVLFTHYHGDHTGQMLRIRPEIPIYAGALAKDIMRLSAERGGQKNEALCKRIETMQAFSPGEPFLIGDIQITPFCIDHSACDSYMFLIEADGKRLLYTGDFRLHGVRGRAELDEIVERSLKSAAIWDEVKDRLKKNALGLSGGQQQRLCIARALAVEPTVLLMDEPTSALDPISTSRIEELAVELKQHYTIVIVTHNMQQALRISDRTAFFLLGELVEYGDTETMFSTPSEKRTEDYITGRFG